MLRVETVGLDQLPLCHALREEVFIEGQSVPREVEIDGEDPQCLHVVAWINDAPVGTARLRIDGPRAHAQRVAVREAYRGQGVGAAVMYKLEGLAAAQGCAEVVLGSQDHAVPFYRAIGYHVVDPEPYVEAGIVHLEMAKALT